MQHIHHWPWKRLALFGIVFWALVATFGELAEEVYEGEPLPGDTAVLEWAYGLSSPLLNQVMLAVTNSGGFVAVTLLTAVAAAVFWYRRRRTKAALLVVTIASLALMNFVLKLFFARARPDLWSQIVSESTYSFPSGHAMMSSALAFTLVLLLWNSRWRWLAVGAAALYVPAVGFSRVYLGVHYPSDIIAGWCISGAWVLLVLATLRAKGIMAQYRRSDQSET